MEFIIQLEDGQEDGPLSEKQLQQRADAGEISSKTQVRSKLLKNWKDASKIPCLENFFDKQEAEIPAEAPSLMNKVREGLSSDDTGKKIAHGAITYGSQFTFKPVSLFSRLMATLFDFIIMAAVLVPIFILMNKFLSEEVLTSKTVLYFSYFATLLGVLIYYSWTIGMRAQTFGQSFWGIMIVRANDGSPVLLGRAYIYTLCMILFGWLTPFMAFITPNNRSVHDLISNCRTILVKGARK